MATEFPDINLTAPSSRAARTWQSASAPERLGGLLIIAGLVVLVALFLVKQSNDTQLSRLRDAVEAERARAQEVETLLAEYETLTTHIHTTLETAIRLERLADAVEREGTPFSTVLEAVATALPPRVSITNLTETDDALIIEGEAGSASLALEFARALQTDPTWKRVRLEKLEEGVPNGPPTAVNFRLRLEK
ncbi:MAG: hypothetical protein D6802_10040 [Ardenticatenia bacterium]|nr:MAG: hypothetical protein D6802_10040 [Ardenticatenia bacterium]